MSALLDIKNLNVQFDTDEGRIVAVENISLSVNAGEVLGVVGESGSGKSVLLKNIIGLLTPDNGSIEINKTNIVNLPRVQKENLLQELGITFQHGALFDSLKNWENIVFKVKNREKLSNKKPLLKAKN